MDPEKWFKQYYHLIFELENDSLIGIGDPYNLDIVDSYMLFAIAISLLSNDVLFAPCDIQYLLPSSSSAVKVDLTKYVEIDEVELWDVVEKLLKFRIFDDKDRSKTELNVMNAIEQYQEAMFSLGGVFAFKSLYAALEKLTKADKSTKESRELKGPALDKEISKITGNPESILKEMRDFNNTLKHSLTPNKYSKYLVNKVKGDLHANLKNAVDNAILYRIK
jgi:hypothetical protein